MKQVDSLQADFSATALQLRLNHTKGSGQAERMRLFKSSHDLGYIGISYDSSAITYRVSECMNSSAELPTQPVSVGVGTVWTWFLSSTTFALWCDAIPVLEFDFGSVCGAAWTTTPDEIFFKSTDSVSEYRLQPGKGMENQ
eukprot:sb/3474260/